MNQTFTFGTTDPFTVNRLGYGAMQLTGAGVWNDPEDRDGAKAVLRRAVELGVNFIDTADAYGPHTNEVLIKEALWPYDGVVIATKGGLLRHGPNVWMACGRPDYLQQCVELSLRRLGVERIDLYQLHRIDPAVPLEDQISVLKKLKDEGKIRHIGLSEVSVEQLKQAQAITEIASVQNLYNAVEKKSEDVLRYCESQNIGFIPWFPLATGELAKPGGPLDIPGATPSQAALMWLLQDSPVHVPIPGTKSIAHLEENCAAAQMVN